MRTHENLIIRRILPSEYGLPESMMYEAIFQPDPAHPYPKEVIYHPRVRCIGIIGEPEKTTAAWLPLLTEQGSELFGYAHSLAERRLRLYR